MRSELPFSAAAERNKDPILDVLRRVLPAAGSVLEIASGTGQHVCHFASALPGIHWQPSDPDDVSREATQLRVREAGLSNVSEPLALDVLHPGWHAQARYDAVLCINMIHISPWAATLSLLQGAAQCLRPRGRLILYGPYFENGAAVQSNLDFDASLKRRNGEWGLRELEEVSRLALAQGLVREELVRMPANNLTVVFARDP